MLVVRLLCRKKKNLSATFYWDCSVITSVHTCLRNDIFKAGTLSLLGGPGLVVAGPGRAKDEKVQPVQFSRSNAHTEIRLKASFDDVGN